MSEEQREQRKRARNIGIHMMDNVHLKDGIMDLIALETELQSGKYSAQEMLDRYEAVYMGVEIQKKE